MTLIGHPHWSVFSSCMYTDLKANQTLNREAGQQLGLLEGEEFSLANFTYSNSAVLRRMVHNLNKTNFLGITVSKTVFGHTFSSDSFSFDWS